ncbi:hypothetical protein WMY93_032381 [Mugilogobius chulae]|uniref:Uncharacterized protein n=1 Tax=Mugilogobius chulae TaxID=88201 RepID=A0AAW0MRM4_9GOBI
MSLQVVSAGRRCRSSCRSSLQVVAAGRRCRSSLQVVAAGRLCRSSLQVVAAGRRLQGRLCRSSLQVVAAGRLCRSSLQVVAAGRLCRSSLQVVSAGRLCRSSLQVSEVSGLSLVRSSFYSTLTSGRALTLKARAASGSFRRLFPVCALLLISAPFLWIKRTNVAVTEPRGRAPLVPGTRSRLARVLARFDLLWPGYVWAMLSRPLTLSQSEHSGRDKSGMAPPSEPPVTRNPAPPPPPLDRDLNAALPLAQDLNAALPLARDLNAALPLARDLNAALPLAQDLNAALPLARDLNAALPLART